MSSIGITLVKFAFVFGVALLGMALRAVLPQNDVTADSRDVVKLGMGLVEMMAALVLGLLIVSAGTNHRQRPRCHNWINYSGARIQSQNDSRGVFIPGSVFWSFPSLP